MQLTNRTASRAVAALLRASALAVGIVLVTPGVGLADPPSIIDVHAHVLNASYLPIYGVLRASHAPRPIARIVAAAVMRATKTSPLHPDVVDIEPQAEVEPVVLRLDERARLLRELEENRLTSDAPTPLSDLTDEELVDEILVKYNFLTGEASEAMHASAPDEISPAGAGLGGYRRFLRLIRKPEVEMAQQMLAESPRVALAVLQMMDLERTYGNPPQIPFKQQIARMKELSARVPGLLFFVSYDPFRGDRALEVVKEGISAGAIGVKFYPPSGYSASANEIPPPPGRWPWSAPVRQWRSRYGGIHGKDLDKLNEALFAYCERQSIPILTHSTPVGFEASSGYGRKSAPRYWEPVLRAHPKLRIIFGHAGGAEGWFDDTAWPGSFAEQAAQLAIRYPQVYLEFGYLDPMMDEGDVSRLRNRLTILYQQTHGRIAKQLLFGTDWHMPQSIGRTAAVIRQFDRAFEGDLAQIAPQLFRDNALDALDLSRVAERPATSTATRFIIARLIAERSQAASGQAP